MAAEGRDGCLEPGQSTRRPGVEWAGRQVEQDELSGVCWWSLAMASSCAWWRAGSCREPRRQHTRGKKRANGKARMQWQKKVLQPGPGPGKGCWRDSRHGGRRNETRVNEDKRLARLGGGATQDCFTGEREERLCRAVSCRYITAWRTAFKEYDGQSKGSKAS